MHPLAQVVAGLALALAPVPVAEEPARDRITFELPIPKEEGGGEIHGSAGALEYRRQDYAVLSGGVRIEYRDLELRAEEMEIDLESQDLVAVGNVILDQGPDRITGATARYNLETRTGTITHASAVAEPGFYFSGDEISKVGADVYVIDDGIFTSCEGAVPAWSFSVGHARVRTEAYARARNASMRVKTVPVLYVPWIVWPTKTDRSSGLLVPKFGSSNDRGSYLGLAYYQVLGRSYDTTIFADLYSKSFFGVGNELRYTPTEKTAGTFRGYAIEDPDRDEWRWKVNFDHTTRDLPFDLRGVVHYEDYSDFEFFRDFERELNYKAKNSIYSSAYVSGNWGSQSFNLLLDQRETFTSSGNVIELRQLPEIEYVVRPTQLWGTPLYLSVNSSAHYLSVDRSATYRGEYGRVELSPEVKLPLSTWPWLSLSVTAGERVTWYGDSIESTSEGTAFTGESLTRAVPTASAQVVGPSFSRIFDVDLGPFTKLKHIVEPRLDWTFEDEFDEQSEIPLFDQVDILSSRNVAKVGIVNRFLAKAEEEGGGGAREILALELFRRYSFDDDQPLERGDGEESQLGPLEATLRSYPSDAFGLRLDAVYSLLFDQITSVRFTGSTSFGTTRFDLSWSPRWQATTGETLSNQLSVGAGFDVVPGKLRVSSSVSYDIERDLLRDQRHFFTWIGSCYTLKLELHESRTSAQRRRDYLFSVDLKNVGTFLDLTGGESEGF